MAQLVKNLLAVQETWVQSLGGAIFSKRKWQPSPIFLSKKFLGQRSLEGYSPQGGRKLDMTEHTRTMESWLGEIRQV